ncbi:MAG: hypothetical protein AB7H80_18495, partial [Candidatus Kapaibacterium sp.]
MFGKLSEVHLSTTVLLFILLAAGVGIAQPTEGSSTLSRVERSEWRVNGRPLLPSDQFHPAPLIPPLSNVRVVVKGGGRQGNSSYSTGGAVVPDDQFWESLLSNDILLEGWDVQAILWSEPYLYVGGNFSRAGDLAVNNIARYNLETGVWEQLGAGEQNGVNGTVYTLAVDNGVLYAGGDFTMAGGEEALGIAAWSLESLNWRDVSGGVKREGGVGGIVREIEFNGAGELYAVGTFEVAGEQSAANIAWWDSEVWHDVGGGLYGSAGPETVVRSIEIENNLVFAAGDFLIADEIFAYGVAVWDGANWKAIGQEGFRTDQIYDIDYSPDFGGVLEIVGGEIVYYTDGSGIDFFAHDLFWSESPPLFGNVSAILNFTLPPGNPPLEIRDVEFGTDSAFYGGHIEEVLTEPGMSIALNDLALLTNGDMPYESFADNLQYDVSRIAHVGSDIAVGGRFGRIGGKQVTGLALRQGDEWLPPGGGVRGGELVDITSVAFTRNNRILFGGEFAGGGDTTFSNIVEWSDGEWKSLGDGLNGRVAALVVGTDERIYAGGTFTRSGKEQVKGVAVWHDGDWQPLVPEDNFWRYADVLGIDPQGRLVVAGERNTPNNLADEIRTVVARFDGTLWEELGGDFGRAHISGIAFSGGDIVVVGDFTSVESGTVPADGVARWSGDGWNPMGGADENNFTRIAGVTLLNGEFIGAGRVSSSPGQSLSKMVRWNEGAGEWGELASLDGEVTAILGNNESRLGVAGMFESVAGVAAHNIALLEGDSWRGMGSGVEGRPDILTVDRTGRLIVAGEDLTHVGEKETYLRGRWNQSISEVRGDSALTAGSL